MTSIPSGWFFCDGNNGMPNLIGRFLQGITTFSTNPGATGGSHTKTVAGSWTFAGGTTTRVAGFTIDKAKVLRSRMDNEGMRGYYCARCGVVLARPIELTASYCYDPKTEKTFLVCKKCKKKRDRVIWD